jgi:hypothetical protein
MMCIGYPTLIGGYLDANNRFHLVSGIICGTKTESELRSAMKYHEYSVKVSSKFVNGLGGSVHVPFLLALLRLLVNREDTLILRATYTGIASMAYTVCTVLLSLGIHICTLRVCSGLWHTATSSSTVLNMI